MDDEMSAAQVETLNKIIQPKATELKQRSEKLKREKEQPLYDKQLGHKNFRAKRVNQAFPNRKVDQEMMMFKEIFIKP